MSLDIKAIGSRHFRYQSWNSDVPDLVAEVTRLERELAEARGKLSVARREISARRDYWKSKNERWWDTDDSPVTACVVSNLNWALAKIDDVLVDGRGE